MHMEPPSNSWAPGTGCDGTIVSSEGRSFPVPISCITSRSSFFQDAFSKANDSCNPGEKPIVCVPNTSSNALHTLLEWMYTHNIRLDEGNIEEILKAAVELNVDGLKEKCLQWCLGNLNFQNCLKLRSVVSTVKDQKVVDAVTRYCVRNFEDLSKNSQDLFDLDFQEFYDLLTDDYLNVKCESLTWQTAVKWMRRKAFRANYCDRLLQTVRMGCLTEEKLEKLKKHEFIAHCDACQSVVQKLCCMKKPNPRIPPSTILTIGGWQGKNPTGVMEVYNVRSDTWQKLTTAAGVYQRAHHGQVVLGEDVYLIGGILSPHTFTNSCVAFNLMQKSWKIVSPMSNTRCFLTAVILDGSIFALGGHNGSQLLSSVECYDRSNNRWTKKRDMHVRRCDAGATVLNGKIYVAGGYEESYYHRSVEVYQAASDMWMFITPMLTPRRGLGFVALNGFVYVMGGTSGAKKLQTVERYHPETRQWYALPDMIHPRSNFGTAVLEGCIYVIGGIFNNTLGEVNCFDPESLRWSRKQNLNVRRSGVGACFISETTLLQKP